jgi:hypothetical protein
MSGRKFSPSYNVIVGETLSGPDNSKDGGAGGIRTLDRALQPYNGLANRRLQPLGHSSVGADMPDTGASRKRQIARRRIRGDLAIKTTGLSGRPGCKVRFSTKSRSGSHGGAAVDRIGMLSTRSRSRTRVICATSVQKRSFAGLWSTSFVLRGQGASVRVTPRRRGAPEVVPFLVVRCPLGACANARSG